MLNDLSMSSVKCTIPLSFFNAHMLRSEEEHVQECLCPTTQRLIFHVRVWCLVLIDGCWIYEFEERKCFLDPLVIGLACIIMMHVACMQGTRRENKQAPSAHVPGYIYSFGFGPSWGLVGVLGASLE
uniref:Uncharacterized protein n=1 Tax=Eutreptiella gymnastica TaxID=73025 RepID=A0A7S4G4T7_9EUGL